MQLRRRESWPNSPLLRYSLLRAVQRLCDDDRDLRIQPFGHVFVFAAIEPAQPGHLRLASVLGGGRSVTGGSGTQPDCSMVLARSTATANRRTRQLPVAKGLTG
jgi:hypothetical protein